MQLQSGTLLQGGKYKIERVLGQGGFGITYLATQVGLNRKVAIKEFFMREYCNRDTDTSHVTVGSEGSRDVVEKFRSKFVKEAQNIACLKHPHIISIHDVFEENGTAYYVMEYLDRGSLAELVKQRGRLSEADALRYIRQIADALRYIHERKMNHLDVKPGNILIDETDGAVLIDFGLSKHYDDEGNQTSTTPVGISHGYAPLEQYKKGGVGTFSPSTDIYSLGATLYKLVTGETPPDANDVNDEGLPAFPSYVSSSVASAIEQAMQPRRKDRPQTIEAFLALLNVDVKEDKDTVVIEEVPSISPKEGRIPNIAEQSTKKQSLTKKWLWLLLICIVAITVFFGVRTYKEQRAENARLVEMEQHRLDSIKAEEAKRIAEEKLKEEERQSFLPTGTISGHDYVDLGLSVKWATCNVGASSPSGRGNYYAWGETGTKSEYEYGNYKYYMDGKIIDIGTNISGTKYDAARVNWGGTWRMPTLEDFEELKNRCTWTWTTQYGEEGFRIMGPNGKSIFLPVTSTHTETFPILSLSDGTSSMKNFLCSNGDYWSATIHSNIHYANMLNINGMSSYYDYGWDGDGAYGHGHRHRSHGNSIRPVTD